MNLRIKTLIIRAARLAVPGPLYFGVRNAITEAAARGGLEFAGVPACVAAKSGGHA